MSDITVALLERNSDCIRVNFGQVYIAAIYEELLKLTLKLVHNFVNKLSSHEIGQM
jgi:hypothetical protein